MNGFFLIASAVLALLLVVGEYRNRRRVRSVRASEVTPEQVRYVAARRPGAGR
ncbi:hypothetical protein ABT093_09985 [Kitasatospora sp. NPDC002551]|uniref:hypothetical protein n=1 Tax=Kitasatospora sp. NPDC002551 TaxID=3154539 RepID=UPI00332D4203